MTCFSVRNFVSTLALALILLGLLGSAGLASRSQAQDPLSDTRKTKSKVAKATDFSIPSAPAFALLDISPANIHTPAYPRDFKLDWILNDDQLASNIAIQAAPVWILFARDLSASKYRDLSPIVRQLYSLDISVATTERSDNRFLTAALKLNIYDGADPLADAEYTAKLSNALGFSEKQDRIQRQLEDIALGARASDEYSADQKAATEALVDSAGKFGPFNLGKVRAYTELSTPDKSELDSLVSRVTALHDELQGVAQNVEERLDAIRRQYEVDHWNATRLDVGSGLVREYDGSQLDSLSLTSRGWGGWITGATGLGTDTERLLLTGMARAITADTALEDDQARYFLGVNLRYRYGSSLNNAFVEYIRRFGDRSNRHEFAYGGSFDLTERLNVQLGLRTSYDDDLELRDLRPTVKINGKASGLLGALTR